MASGSIGGGEEIPKKNKWNENSKVYSRKTNRIPKSNNSKPSSGAVTVPVLNTQLVHKKAAESNGGEKIRVVNGTKSKSPENNLERVVEEAPTIENRIDEVPTKNDVVEEMVIDRNVDKVVSNNGNEIENVSEKVSVDVNNNMNLEEAPVKEKNGEEVSRDENCVEEIVIKEKNVEDGPHKEKSVEEDPQNDVVIDEEMPQQSSSPKLAEFSELQQNQPNVDTGTVSEHSSSHNRVEQTLPNGHEPEHEHDENLGNGVVREEVIGEDENEEEEEEEEDERPMVTQFDDRLNISVTSAKSVEEVRDLKRKLEGELDQVRKMARKLEAKESQLLTSISFASKTLNEPPPPPTLPSIRRLHIPINGGTRPTQELGSVSYTHPRPFGDLSVSVMENTYHGLNEIPHEKEKRTPKANQYYRNSDFLLGKERLPPAENNRRTKSSGGGSKKHGKGEFDLGLGFDKKINKKCSELLQKLRKHKHGWVFNQPVDVKSLGLHDYFDIIKHPMDLGTVKTRLTNHWYKTPREFAEDVRLTFHNAMTYNPAGQDVHIMAKDLLKIFEDKWPPIEAEYDRRLRYEMFRDLGTPTPTSRRMYDSHMPLPPPPILRAPPNFHESRILDRSQSMPVRPESRPKPIPMVRTPAPKKPKARDVNKRDMTFDEKQKLSTHLQGLPSEKLDVIVQIIKKRNTSLAQHDDEVEVDIDSLDTETLWELDRFVTNYKKSLSKYKRKAELAAEAQVRAAANPVPLLQPVPETAPAPPPVIEPPRETRVDEGNVASEAVGQQERPNVSESSSSSGSSSDSGSSSSDSDSSSSSDSESEGERS